MQHPRILLLGPAYLISVVALMATVFTDDIAITGPCYVGLQVAGLITNVAAARAAEHGRAQRTWWLLVLGFVFMIAATVFFTLAGLITSTEGVVQVHQGWLVAGIVTRFLFTVVLVGALLTLSDRPLHRGERWRLGLDSATMLGGGLMLIWFFILGPVTTGVRGTYVTLVWELTIIPFGDLALIMAMGAVLMRGASPAGRRPLQLLLLASISWFASDFLGTITSIRPQSHPIPETFADVAQIIPLVLMVTAAAEQYRLHLGSHEGMAARRLRPITWLPYVALVGGFTLLAVAANNDRDYPWFGLILGAGLMTFCVAARQFTVLQENRSLATKDVLTGLANRIRLHEVLNDLDERYLPDGRQCAVMVIDLDDFKPVNDTLGHEAGDDLLIAFAQVLRDNVRASDTAARLGGDEFSVVLLDIRSHEQAIQVAERILAVLETPFTIAGREVRIRASIGIAVTAGDSLSDDLMREADLAMYEAKRERTVGWQLFVPGSSDARQEQARLRDELRRAVDSGQLRVVYQPIIALATERVVGFEALVRWEHPTRGLLTPDAFLPLAERTGIVHDIDFWVLRNACRQMGDWRAELPGGRGLHLNANLSAGQLKRANLAALVMAVLTETGFDPRELVLEITETSALVVSDALTHVTRLRERGVRIALDDFGTGHSSLEHLLRMPVDIIKLDRCFVTELNEERASLAIAQAVVRLGQVLDLDTVAEGIETPEQARAMLDLGYDHGQGYHFARPLTAEDVPAFLARVNSLDQAGLHPIGR
jgi:diguanylate cyclase (GGDEF)-like protein